MSIGTTRSPTTAAPIKLRRSFSRLQRDPRIRYVRYDDFVDVVEAMAERSVLLVRSACT